jgi:predicted aspartyl protease
VESTTVEEFKIGSLVRTDWQVMVAGERDSGVDILLGEDVFDKVDVEFDLPHNQVRLFQPIQCEGVALAYWSPQQASQVKLGSGPKIVVPVKINGRVVHAVLDSGAEVSVLNSAVAKGLGLTPNSPGVVFSGKRGGVGANLIDSWLAPLRSFSIGSETISETVIRFAELGLGAEMLLGADFLRAHRVLVSHSQRKMYFTYEGGPVFETRVSPSADESSNERPAKPAQQEDGRTSPAKGD